MGQERKGGETEGMGKEKGDLGEGGRFAPKGRLGFAVDQYDSGE